MNLERAAFIILGIRNATDPASLLGIPNWNGSVPTLEAAIRKRVAQILSHPLSHSDEASLVREAIQEAGIILAKQCHSDYKEVEKEKHELTQLDRSIIAVLVSEGGWNRQSRSRLVAVSAAYGLTVGGLLRILTALAESARSGGGPLSQKSRKSNLPDRSWATLPIVEKKQNVVDELMDEMASKYLPELKEYSTATTIKLSAIFGLLTILAIILGLRVLTLASEEAQRVAAAAAEADRQLHNIVQSNSSFTQLQHQNCFAIYPTFEEEIFTEEIGVMVDVTPELPRTFRDLKNVIEVSIARSETVPADFLSRWDGALRTISSAWPFVDNQLQEEIGTLVHDIIAVSPQRPGLTEKLLKTFRDILRDEQQEFNIFKRPWFFGELARLSCSNELLPSTKKLVKEVAHKFSLDCDVYQMRREVTRLLGIELVKSTELVQGRFLPWEQWLAIVNRETDATLSTSLKLQVITFIVHNSVDLTRESDTRRVLGRLLQEVDWIRSDLARESLLHMFLDEQASAVDLWAITNMLVDRKAIPWLLSEHAIQIDDDLSKREQVENELQVLWPQVESTKTQVHTLLIPAGFDPALILVWEELTLLCDDKSASPVERFVHARRLNEIAAAIWVGRPSRAWELVDNIDQATMYEDAPALPTGGRSSGKLHQRFANTNRDPDAMLELLNFVRSSEYASLHPRDAATVVRAAYFYSDLEIREEAVALICDQFSRNSDIAVAIVNVLTKNAKTQQVESLVAYLTDVILPPRHDSNWLTTARKALVQHALTAGNQNLTGLDAAAISAGISALGESLIVDPSRLRPMQEIDVNQAYDRLLRAWRKRLGINIPLKNKNSSNVLENQLRQQLEYIQLLLQLELVWSGEKSMTDDLKKIGASQTLVEQISEAEIASLRIWKRMLQLAKEEFDGGVSQ